MQCSAAHRGYVSNVNWPLRPGEQTRLIVLFVPWNLPPAPRDDIPIPVHCNSHPLDTEGRMQAPCSVYLYTVGPKTAGL